MTVHELKTWPGPFQAIRDGRKAFEIRRTDDRRFEVGDGLHLREWDPMTGLYTGRSASAVVSYIASPGDWGLPPRLCVLGLALIRNLETGAGADKERDDG